MESCNRLSFGDIGRDQNNMEHRTLAFSAVNGDGSAELLHNLTDESQADARSRYAIDVVGLIERLEDMRQAGLWYAPACVADVQAQPQALLPHIDVHFPLRRSELQCVGQQIAHNLVDIVRHVGSFYLGLTGHELQT